MIIFDDVLFAKIVDNIHFARRTLFSNYLPIIGNLFVSVKEVINKIKG
jgi:hypothetical protein